MDEIHEVTGMKLAELRDVTTDRKQWRRMVKTAARTQQVDRQGDKVSTGTDLFYKKALIVAIIVHYIDVGFIIIKSYIVLLNID